MSQPVRSVAQAFAILRLLADGDGLTLSEIGRALDLSPSSCFNLLNTLVAEGAIVRGAGGKRYRLAGPWDGFEGLRDRAGRSLIDRARPLMARLAQQGDAAVGLWKMASRDRLQLVAHAESDAVMRLRFADAQRQPLGGGAAGRALAAAQRVDDAELARRYAPVRWQADLPFDVYAAQVREAAARGYAIDRGFAHRGIWTVAVGIADVTPGFCLSASIVAGSRGEAEVAQLAAALGQLRARLVADQ